MKKRARWSGTVVAAILSILAIGVDAAPRTPRLQVLCTSGSGTTTVGYLEANLQLRECHSTSNTGSQRFLSAAPGECWPNLAPIALGTIELPTLGQPAEARGSFVVQREGGASEMYRVCGALITLIEAPPNQTLLGQSALVAEGNERSCQGSILRRGDSFYLSNLTYLPDATEPYILTCRFTMY